MRLFDAFRKKNNKQILQERVSQKNEASVSDSEAPNGVKKMKSDEIGSIVLPKPVSAFARRVLVRPHVSEKAALGETAGVYTFVVSPRATKIEIRQAVKERYGVRPEKIRIVHVEGKEKRFGNTIGRRADWKKAIVTLPKGTSISIHEGV